MSPLGFNGPQERKLAQIASAPRYTFGGATELVELLDSSGRTWREASSCPGWEGQAAEAAAVAFRRGAADAVEHARLIEESLSLLDEANTALTQARHDYQALPPTAIPGNVVNQAIAGAPLSVPGFGLVATPMAVHALAGFLSARREDAAREAVVAFSTRMDALADRMAAVNSAARTPGTVTPAGFGPLPLTAGSARPSLDDILTDYQVSDDPDGMTQWPGWPESWFVKPQKMTETEAAMLDDVYWNLGIFGILMLEGMRTDAFTEANERFPSTPQAAVNDDHNDAFRHAYWNALMEASMPQGFAERFGTAHEGSPDNTAPAREAMDLYNNEVGRRIAAENPKASNEELADLVEEAVRDGEMVVIGPDGNLAWSDDIPEGGTGHPEPGTALPGNENWDEVVAGATS